MKRFLYHFFVPHESNNFRAKILHTSTIFILLLCLLFLNFSTLFLKKNHPGILGISYSVSSQELLDITNKVRRENNLPPLVFNEKLAGAAQKKASDMIAKNYWAHFAPDGTTPWDFIKGTGYDYTFAGENLAKGFTTSPEIVDAWMNSSTHKENIVSSKYKDIGFSIVEGKLLGEDTVLVVELFGSEEATHIAALPESSEVSLEAAVLQVPVVEPKENIRPILGQSGQPQSIADKNVVIIQPLINISSASKGILLPLFSLLTLGFLIDFIILERRKIPRLIGHNLDHIMLIVLFIVTVFLQRTGFVF